MNPNPTRKMLDRHRTIPEIEQASKGTQEKGNCGCPSPLKRKAKTAEVPTAINWVKGKVEALPLPTWLGCGLRSASQQSDSRCSSDKADSKTSALEFLGANDARDLASRYFTPQESSEARPPDARKRQIIIQGPPSVGDAGFSHQCRGREGLSRYYLRLATCDGSN